MATKGSVPMEQIMEKVVFGEVLGPSETNYPKTDNGHVEITPAECINDTAILRVIKDGRCLARVFLRGEQSFALADILTSLKTDR